MNRDSVVRLQPVFSLLRESTELASKRKMNQWQYAIHIDQLYHKGANEHDLGQLVRLGLSQHGVETSFNQSAERTFLQGGSNFGPKSCFILSQEGVNVMKGAGIEHRQDDGQIPLTPSWNPGKNELRIAGQLVKRFKWRAPNQEQLISAFEEKGWPRTIDDPLDKDELVHPKRRLHDTIKCLNRRHVRDIMRFHGDGTGLGVEWRISIPGKEDLPGLSDGDRVCP